MPKRNLTDKQQRFIDEYMIDLNATQACLRAGYKTKNPDRVGPELLGKTWVKEEIERRKAVRAERLEIDSDWVLKRLHEEAEADLADIYNEDGSLKPIHDWPVIFRKGLVTGIDVATITGSAEEVATRIDKIKMSERIKRLELIGKHVKVQAFKDRVEQETTHKFTGDVSPDMMKLIIGE